MKILFVSCVYPPLSGGVGYVVQDYARNLSDFGHEVFIFTGGNSQEESFDGKIKIYKVDSFPQTSPCLVSDYNNDNFVAYFQSIIKNNKIELVHFHAIQGLGSNLLKVSLSMKIKTVLTMHDFWWSCPFLFNHDEYARPVLIKNHHLYCSESVSQEFLIKRKNYLEEILANPNLIVSTVSKTMQKSLSRGLPTLKNKIILIENLMNINLPSISSLKNDIFTFSYFGKMNPSKGSHILMQAIDLLSKERKDFRVDLYGTLESLSKLEKIKNNHFNTLTVHHETIKREEVINKIASSDAVIVPSIVHESFSLVAREVLACNRLLISTNMGALSELNGELVKKYHALSPTALAITMSEAIDNRGKIKNSLEQIKKNFTSNKLKNKSLITNLINIYES